MVITPNFRSGGPRFDSHWRPNSSYDCMALHCIEPFIITCPLSQYDLCNVEKDIKHQIIIIIISDDVQLRAENAQSHDHSFLRYPVR